MCLGMAKIPRERVPTGIFSIREGYGDNFIPNFLFGKGAGKFFTQFLIRGGDGDEVESPSPTHFPILIFIF